MPLLKQVNDNPSKNTSIEMKSVSLKRKFSSETLEVPETKTIETEYNTKTITPLTLNHCSTWSQTSGRVLRKSRRKKSVVLDDEMNDCKSSLLTVQYFIPITPRLYNDIDEELGDRIKRIQGVPEIIISGLSKRMKTVFSKRSGVRVGKTGIFQHSDGLQWKICLKSINGLPLALENFLALNLPLIQEDPLYFNCSLSFLQTREKQKFQRAHLDYFWNHLSGRAPEDLPWICILPLSEDGMKLHVWPCAGVGKVLKISLGELVFLRGDVVHAGGIGGTRSPRCHLYLPKFSSDYDESQGTNWKDPNGKMICHSHFIPRSSYSVFL